MPVGIPIMVVEGKRKDVSSYRGCSFSRSGEKKWFFFSRIDFSFAQKLCLLKLSM